MKVIVTRKSHARREKRRAAKGEQASSVLKIYKKGDTFDATDRELKAFSDRLQPVSGKAETKAPEKGEGKAETKAPEKGEGKAETKAPEKGEGKNAPDSSASKGDS